MRVLNLEECKAVVSRLNKHEPWWAISATMGITQKDVALIARCKRKKFPLEDYKLIEQPGYKYSPLDEPSNGWDMRLSMRLSRLPMSEWAAAL